MRDHAGLSRKEKNLLLPGHRPYPPACKPYGLEAGPEAATLANLPEADKAGGE
jgi:hypothetical protein